MLQSEAVTGVEFTDQRKPMMLKKMLLTASALAMTLSTFAMQPVSSLGASASITSLLGIVQARTIAGWRQSIAHQRLYPGMALRTGDFSRTEIRYDDGSVVRVGPRTLIGIRDIRNLNLLRGKTLIQKQPTSMQFRVQTPVAHATVLGTELFVSHNEENISHVTTLDGHVEVEGDLGDKQMVNPGEWVEIEPGKKLEKPTRFDWNKLKQNERFLLDMNFVPTSHDVVDAEEWK